MSSIWTPDGERPIKQEPINPSTAPEEPSIRRPAGFENSRPSEPTPEEHAAQMAELRRQLAETPASLVIANHCFGLFELAGLHLSTQPPQLGEAQLAIDALGALLENLDGRLGEPEVQLREGLSQLRLAFVQIRQANTPTNGQ